MSDLLSEVCVGAPLAQPTPYRGDSRYLAMASGGDPQRLAVWDTLRNDTLLLGKHFPPSNLRCDSRRQGSEFRVRWPVIGQRLSSAVDRSDRTAALPVLFWTPMDTGVDEWTS